MNLRKEKGAIAIFVLVALLFMSSFLIILYASNVNKSKVVKEQFNIISGIYAHSGGDEGAYEKAYTDLRKKNKRIYSYANGTDAGETIFTNTNSVELKRTFIGKIMDYRIYGNTEHTKIRYIPTLENQGFIPLTNGATYPTTNESYQNATYEIIEIKEGQKLTFNYTGTDASKLRVRCIDSTTDKVVGDLVHASESEVTETDYYTTTIYYYHSTPDNGFTPEGYVVAKKDFKIGIMYIDTKPDDFNLLIYGNITKELGDLVTDSTDENYGKYKIPIKLTKENGESTVTNIYLNEPLRRVQHSAGYIYSDYIDFKNQKVVRINKKIYFDGSEDWYKPASKTDYDAITIRSISLGYKLARSNLVAISDQYTHLGAIWNCFDSSYSWRYGNYNNNIYISIDNKTLGVTSESTTDERTQKLVDYVKANNFWILYPLATPEEEDIDIPELDTFEDYTKIEILTELQPSKIELEYERYSL